MVLELVEGGAGRGHALHHLVQRRDDGVEGGAALVERHLVRVRLRVRARAEGEG